PDGEVRQHQAVELLVDQFGCLTPQDDLASSQMGFQLIERGFDLPAFVVESGELQSWCLVLVEKAGDETVEGLGILQTRELIVDDAHHLAVAILLPILVGRIDLAEVGAVGEALDRCQDPTGLDTPEQIGSCAGGLLPQPKPKKQTIGQAQPARLELLYNVAG